jgi:hypothetical protein
VIGLQKRSQIRWRKDRFVQFATGETHFDLSSLTGPQRPSILDSDHTLEMSAQRHPSAFESAYLFRILSHPSLLSLPCCSLPPNFPA